MGFLEKMIDKFDGDKTFKFCDLDMLDPTRPWINSGSPALDYNMGTFGFPIGIIEVRGESQSGKTTFSLQAIKNCLSQYGERAVVTILSSERRDNKEYAQAMGIDTNRIIVHRITTMEGVFNKIFQTIKNANEALMEQFKEEGKHEKTDDIEAYMVKRQVEFGRLRFFFVWDSLGQTVSSQELAKAKTNADNDVDDKSALASGARALSGGLRAISGLIDEEDMTLFIINRPYDKVDGQPGKVSYGGKAIMLWPTLRIELARVEGFKVGEEEVGQKTQVTIIKSDFTSPKQKFNVEIGYGLGIMLGADDIAFAIEHGILVKHGVGGAKFTVGTKVLQWTSRKGLYELYEKQEPMLKVLLSKLNKAVRDKIIEQKKRQKLL